MTVPSSCCSRWLYLRESSRPPWEYFWNQTDVVGKVTMVMKGKVIITDIRMWSDYQVHQEGSYEPVGVPGSWTTSIWQQGIHSLTQLTGSSPLHLTRLGFQFPLDCICWSWPERVCGEHVTSCTPPIVAQESTKSAGDYRISKDHNPYIRLMKLVEKSIW